MTLRKATERWPRVCVRILDPEQNLERAHFLPKASLTFSSNSAPEQWETAWFGYTFVCKQVKSSKPVVEIKIIYSSAPSFFTLLFLLFAYLKLLCQLHPVSWKPRPSFLIPLLIHQFSLISSSTWEIRILSLILSLHFWSSSQ